MVNLMKDEPEAICMSDAMPPIENKGTNKPIEGTF